MGNILNFPPTKSLSQRTAELITDASIEPEILEEASIQMLQKRIDSLQKQRGRSDWRLPIIVISTLTMIWMVRAWNFWSIPLLAITLGGIYIGGKVNSLIVKIDQEIAACHLLLVELLKEKILKQTQQVVRKNVSPSPLED